MIDNHKIKKFNSIQFIVVGLFATLVLLGCENKSELSKPCDPLPVIDGYKTINVTKGNFTLRLPDYADVRRQRGEDRGCDYLSGLYIDYLWYEGKLVSAGKNRLKLPDHAVKVRLYFQSSGFVDAARERFRNDPIEIKRPWRFDGAIPHKRFPLEYYPKVVWDDPDNPSELALKRTGYRAFWGIRNTKYKNPINGRPFMATCAIPVLNGADQNSRIENDFEKYGDSKCRGYITAAKDGKYLNFMVDVWAYLGAGGNGAMEINLIYDAVVEALQSFMQD